MNVLAITFSLSLSVNNPWTFASEAPNGASMMATNGIPVELRDEIFKNNDIKDYADYLNVSSATRRGCASDKFEHGLLERSALELDSLNIQFWRDRERTKRILSGVQTLVRLRFGLSLGEHEPEIPKDAVQALQANFKTLASLSKNDLWHPTVLTALVGKTPWDALFYRLSDDFITDHLDVLLHTITAAGNFPLLDRLIESRHLPRDVHLMHKLIPAVVFAGSISFFNMVYASLPSQDSTLYLALTYSLMFNRHELFRYLWAKSVSDGPASACQEILEKSFYATCSHGDLRIWQETMEAYPGLCERPKVLNCLQYASAYGNMPILRHVLWDDEQQCQRADFKLEVRELSANVNMAAHLNQMEALRFLLFELDECSCSDFSSVLQVIAIDALASRHLEVFELLLGRDRHGAYFIPDFSFDFENNGILVDLAEKGWTDLLTYLVEKRASMGQFDPRWNSLDLNYMGNTMLRVACANGQLNIVQFLLQKDEESGQYVYPNINPAADNNTCLLHACASKRLEIVKELFRTDKRGHRVHPTVRLGVPNDGPLLNVIAYGALDILEFLLHRVQEEDGTFHYTIPDAAICIQNPALIRAAVETQQYDILNFLLQLDSHGQPFHPTVRLPPGFLGDMVRREWTDLLRASLGRHVNNRQEELRQALGVALEKRHLQATYLLVNALHGPLPALETQDGDVRLVDALVTHAYLSRLQVLSNILSPDPWGNSMKKWMKKRISRN